MSYKKVRVFFTNVFDEEVSSEITKGTDRAELNRVILDWVMSASLALSAAPDTVSYAHELIFSNDVVAFRRIVLNTAVKLGMKYVESGMNQLRSDLSSALYSNNIDRLGEDGELSSLLPPSVAGSMPINADEMSELFLTNAWYLVMVLLLAHYQHTKWFNSLE